MSDRVRSMQKARERKQAQENPQTITATLAQLLQTLGQNPGFPGALDVLYGQPIPIKTSFRLCKIALAVGEEVKRFNETKKILCERFSNKDDEGKAIMLNAENRPIKEGEAGRYDIPPDKMADFEKEYGELIATEVTIPGQQIKIADIGNVTIAPAHLMNLEWLITD